MMLVACSHPTDANDDATGTTMNKIPSTTVTHVDVSEAAELLQSNSDIVVLDVRTGWEYRRGHIDGARNINYLMPGFRSKVRELDPTARYLVLCKSGHRSTRALSILNKAGIKKLIHLDGGMDSWKKAGQAVSR